MASTVSVSSPSPSEPSNASSNTLSSRFPAAVSTISRLKSFSSNFIQTHRPPPVVFPPPSWDLSDDNLGAGRSATPTLPESNDEPMVEEPPEPVSFAAKLKSMIEALPIPGSSNPEPAKDDEINPPSPVPSDLDKSMVRMLSSEQVMNGASSTSKEGGSVWNILAGLKQGKRDDTSKPSVTEEEEHGLMMYAPLEPKADSEVELATSETIVEENDKKTEVATPPNEDSKSTEEIIEKHVWVPSTTELSVLTTWWGYRIYLPPAVMAKLNGKSLQATARAAMLTTALKWLLNKIPLAIVPPQFRPAVKLLKTLTPLTGYIGVFIAWSWERISSLDNGNGVVLTATWLLPVALLPMAWDAGAIFRPVAAPTPEELKAIEEAALKAAEEKRKAEQPQQNQNDQKKKSFFHW
ncbi:hypothetical protein CPB83DRAFT_760318 [Crepidotus variabilis]|uniref:Uncharacterized protein n=1 Tax=Crepidotus variabilis TaxID=179855 RepID=A0A9P6END9_9AGAR|nr:hypothetical protein CPB83DRAFT_760318 [Crepidotus variabilis]